MLLRRLHLLLEPVQVLEDELLGLGCHLAGAGVVGQVFGAAVTETISHHSLTSKFECLSVLRDVQDVVCDVHEDDGLGGRVLVAEAVLTTAADKHLSEN